MSECDPRIFEGVAAYISAALPELQRSQITTLLTSKMGRIVDCTDRELTHYITDTLPTADSLERVEPRTGLFFVTPYWVQRTIALGTRQEPAFYSPHPSMLFSGVVATSCSLSQEDNEIMAAGISSLGGQWRKAITRDVTHIFALSGGTNKFNTAMHFKEKSGMKVLVPHWFDDTVRLGIRNLSTEPYEWPRPHVFEGQAARTLRQLASSPAEVEDSSVVRRPKPPSEQKKAFYDTIFRESSDLPNNRPASSRIWEGRKIMFGSNLRFKPSQREAHIADVLRAGGEVVEFDTPEEELERLDEADIYIAQYRSGRAFVKAYKLKKLIGNLHWFWYVRSTGILSRPTDQLLHYPIPMKPIEGFSRHVITVTNYSGKDREYIKKMLLMLGVPYTPTMSGNNTAVIAAYRAGEKVKKADDWAVPVVNHLWLEDCFAQWRDIAPTLDRYTIFPPGVDFGELLAEDGGRAVLGMVAGMSGGSRVGYDQTELDRMEREIEAEDAVVEEVIKPSQGRSEVMETPKRGILKKTKGATEDAAATSRRLAEERKRRAGGGTDGDVATGPYVDMNVELDADGRLSMSGSELGFGDRRDDEERMDIDEPRGRPAAKDATKAKPRPSTPVRGRGRSSSGGSKPQVMPARARAPSTSRSQTRAKPAEPSNGDGEESDRPSTPPRGRRAQRAKPASEDEEPEDEEPSRAVRPISRKAAMKGKSGKRAYDAEDVFDVGGSARKGTVIKTYRAKSRSRSRSRARPAARDEDDYAPRGKVKSKLVSEDEGGSEIKKTPVRSAKTGAKRKLAVTTDSETEEEQLPRAKQKGSRRDVDEDEEDAIAVEELTTSPRRAGTPRRRASVVLPTLKEVLSSSQRNINASQHDEAAPTEESPLSKVKALSKESPKDLAKKSPTKRGRPPSSRSTKPPVTKPASPVRPPSPSPPPAPKPRRGRHSAAASVVQVEAGPSRAEPADTDSPARTASRRSAATKAAQKLHDEIMPDANSFAKELKSGHVKGYEEPAPTKGKGKEREKAEPAKGRKRPTVNEDEADEDEERDAKKRKTDAGPVVAKGRPRKLEVPPSDEDELEIVEEPKRRGRPAKAKAESTVSTDPRNVVIMTTQVTLTDDQTKVLTKLGAKFTTKPLECTHLVAHKIVRTEKFLCAMAVAPHIVSAKWVEACVLKKSLQPEGSFALKDPESEKRYGYKLSDALARARKGGRKLFEGKTFYVTPKVPVDTKLLKAVVTAGGGQLLSQSPTVRILKGHDDDRFVISCPADVSIWRPLAEHGYPVYSQELILTGVLKQELHWDDPTYKVPSSF